MVYGNKGRTAEYVRQPQSPRQVSRAVFAGGELIMKKPNITEGEWEWVKCDHKGMDSRFGLVASRTPGPNCSVLFHQARFEVTPEDRQVISAVPEMIEALIEAKKFADAMASPYLGTEVELKKQIEQALKKAGVQP